MRTVTIDIWEKLRERISVPQREILGRTIRFTLTDRAVPINLTASTVTIYATKPSGAIVFNALTIITAASGIAQITLTEQMIVEAGTLACTLLIVDGSANETRTQPFDIEVVASPDFTSSVESSSEYNAFAAALAQVATNTTNIGDLAYTENNYIADEEPLTESVDKLDMQVKDNTTNIGDLTYAENNYITDGEPLTDSVDKLDIESHKKEIALSPGESFVSKMLDLMRVRGMYAYVSGSTLKIGVGLNDGLSSVVEYNFINNADDLLLLRGVYSGVESTTNTDWTIDSTQTGTFTGSEPHIYTATPGNYFTSTFKGFKAVNFKRLKETRGGMWEFKITQNSLEVRDRVLASCYGDDTALAETLLFDELDPRLEYVVISTFLGDDPNHAPSSSPSRGYIYYKAADALYKPIIARNIVKPLESTTAKEIISSASIPDFAISAKPYGAAYATEWVPAHSTSGVSGSVGVKLLIDGDDMSLVAGAMPSFTYRQLDDFELSQYFQALNPNGSDGAMWDHYVTHSIRSSKPYLAIQNGIEFLQDTDVGVAYLAMLPSKQSVVDALVLNNGTVYDTLPGDGSEATFGYDVNSAMFVGDFASGNYHAAAFDIASIREAGGYSTDHKPTAQGLITFRVDDVVKVYFVASSANYKFETGDRLSCKQRICCISGVRSPNINLASLY